MLQNEIIFDAGKDNKSSCYFTKKTPLPNFNTGCKECSLGRGKCVGPTGPDDFSNIKLIILSEHPGYYETELGFNQVPNSFIQSRKDFKTKRDRLPSIMNGGELMRRAVENLFNVHHQNETYYSNALKTDPAQYTVSKTKHIYKCVNQWLVSEFDLLDTYAPGVPVIVCGTKALNAIEFLYPEIKNKVDIVDLKHTRRRKDLRIGLTNRPIAVTFNPAMPAKGHSRIETTLHTNRVTGAIEVKSVKDWQPIVLGSPLWHFIKDIQWLKEFIS